MRTTGVGLKRWHPQIFAHRILVEMQTADDFCLSFPLCSEFMHVLMHRHLPSTPGTGRRGLAPLITRLDRLRWSQGRLLEVLFHLLACLTEHLDLLRQRFLDHFSQIFEHMPTIEDAVRACGAPLGAAFR
jgi:hypothetical protein